MPFMHFPDTVRAPFEYPNRTTTTEVFRVCSRVAPPALICTSSLDTLIVPFRYLFGTLLVTKVATGGSNAFDSEESL